MATITCIDDLRALYRRRVPRMFAEYGESGSWTETTLRRNRSAFDELWFRPRVAIDVERRSIEAGLLGEKYRMPVALAPVGLAGMQRADGEILAARAAERFGVPFTLSMMGICSIEDVAARTGRPFWFQFYMMKDRQFTADIIDRAKRAGCSALVMTLDVQLVGQRHADIRNRMTIPPALTVRNLLNMATKPRWALGMLGTRRRFFRNLEGHVEGVTTREQLFQWAAGQLNPASDWADVEWVKEKWGGKLILKGIMDREDARLAADCGADAIVVSNHGGRQLDGAPAALDVLPGIVDEAGDRLEVWMDGGIRSGQDVLRALALGARGTMIGRSFLYGLGAMGEAGVTRCLEIIARELDLTMAFCGCKNLSEVNASILWRQRPVQQTENGQVT